MKSTNYSRSRYSRFALVIAISCLIVLAADAADLKPLKVLSKWDMKSAGRWDYIIPDSQDGRLYVARTTRFMVLDIKSGVLLGEIPSATTAHGIVLAKELGVGFTSDGGSNTSTVFDLKSLKVEGKVPVGKNPDAITYDSATKRIFVNNKDGHDLSVIDAEKRRVIGTIKVPGAPEYAVNDGQGSIFTNLETVPGKLVQVDIRSMAIKNTFTLGSCEEPAGLGIDKKKRILFVGCSNGKLAVVNANTGKVLQLLPIGEDADGVFFDEGLGLAYVSTGGDGKVVVVAEKAGRYSIVQSFSTAEGSKTMGLDLETHMLYVPTAKFGPLPAGAKRPPVIPETFAIQVIGR